MLESLIRKEIQEKGPLSQSRFMELALSHSTFGYYRSQEAIGGDFTTSPEVSQVFGELISAWSIDYYEKWDEPKNISLVELGPGKGTLMADFLRVAKKLSPRFCQALNIYMVEINPVLKAIQQKTISHTLNYVEKFSQIPNSAGPMIIIANEFFDVFPTHCYIRKDNILYERCIDQKEDKFVFTLVEKGDDEGPDQIWEKSSQAKGFMHEICARLVRQDGIFLCIDYGYEQGEGDSLQALFEKKPSDPLSHVGRSDLTCHVNFSCLKEIALSYGLGVSGPLPQGQFLKNIGLDVRIEMLKYKNPSKKQSLEVGAIRLTHPEQMGSLFKVMAVFSPSSLISIGFENES